MELNLVSLVEKQRSLHPLKLVDESFHLGPEKKNRSSMYLAWLWDWGLSFFVAASVVGAWTEFLSLLVFDYISVEAEMAFIGSTTALTWILAPLVHFTHTSLGLLSGGQTFGMRAFKHTVTDQYKSLDWKQALLWSVGSTVSLLTLGTTSFLLDSLCQTTTTTNAHHYWKFSKISSIDKETAPDLLQLIEEESAANDQKIAA